jgi:Uma2 family endonuclease
MAVQAKITADDFLQLPETNLPTELIDGEIIVAPAPKASHQNTVFSSAKTIEKIAPHGKVYISPIDVYLDERNVVQPDVMWNGTDSQCILIDDSYWRGAPDLVVEVLSPSTALRDKQTKFRLYEKYGVREYWMVEPAAQYVEVWYLVEGKFALHGVFGVGETFTSTVFGNKSVDVSLIFGS